MTTAAGSGDKRAASPPGQVHALIDRLASRWADGPHRDEVARAREQYFEQAGKVFEDDGDLYERRMTSFLEWYVIERPLGQGPPPVIRALENDGGEADLAVDEAERRTLAAIAASHRSLFDIAAVEGHQIHVEDVISGARFSVLERRGTVGFEVGDLLEARLVWDGQEIIFAKTFLFHPRDAREQVLDVVDVDLGKGEGREAIMFHLSRLHVRWHRLGHVGAARVYREGTVR